MMTRHSSKTRVRRQQVSAKTDGREDEAEAQMVLRGRDASAGIADGQVAEPLTCMYELGSQPDQRTGSPCSKMGMFSILARRCPRQDSRGGYDAMI
jgi:hypothetical protein